MGVKFMKKLLLSIISILLLFSIIGCGAQKNESGAKDKKTIKVGASPLPHKEILEKVKPILKEKGYDLEIVVLTDYVTPNTSLQDGDLDANFFQHTPYLNKFNQEKGTDLEVAAKVHIEPMGIYSKKIKDLKELKAGAEIAIPNDPTNGSRALRVLETAGIIKLKTGDLVTKLDIVENKKNIKIKELDAPQLPRVLSELDAAVINTNYALEAGLNPNKNSLAIESKDSPYANILAIKKGDKNKPYIKALIKALNSPEIKKFIEEKYNGSIIPAF